MPSVLPEWISELPLQQQSVLLLALRGPDGVRKHHPMKAIQRCYRGTILKAAAYNRMLDVGEKADNFMCMENIGDLQLWGEMIKDYFAYIDELPHHFHMHLMHGAEILGYSHPEPWLRGRWYRFYKACCDDAHVPLETKYQMDRRLSDWDRESWVDT